MIPPNVDAAVRKALQKLPADRFASAVGDELLRRVDGETDSRELIVGVATATNVHLRELTALPSTAANHFETRLARESLDT